MQGLAIGGKKQSNVFIGHYLCLLCLRKNKASKKKRK